MNIQTRLSSIIDDTHRRSTICINLVQFQYVWYSVQGYGWGDLRERDHWGDPGVGGRIILRWTFRKWDGVVGIAWRWLRIGTGGGHL
jgi:hypothetical protein